jgi:hypothetical protein
VEDHNETGNQLRSLWMETEDLHRQVDRLRTHIITLAGLLTVALILLGVVAYYAV